MLLYFTSIECLTNKMVYKYLNTCRFKEMSWTETKQHFYELHTENQQMTLKCKLADTGNKWASLYKHIPSSSHGNTDKLTKILAAMQQRAVYADLSCRLAGFDNADALFAEGGRSTLNQFVQSTLKDDGAGHICDSAQKTNNPYTFPDARMAQDITVPKLENPDVTPTKESAQSLTITVLKWLPKICEVTASPCLMVELTLSRCWLYLCWIQSRKVRCIPIRRLLCVWIVLAEFVQLTF